jgi:uncharacterized protein (DUF2164 family)
MSSPKRDLLGLTQDQKTKAINELIAYFDLERGEEIGVIAAEEILTHVLQGAGRFLYNKGIEDASALLRQQVDALDSDLDALKRS